MSDSVWASVTLLRQSANTFGIRKLLKLTVSDGRHDAPAIYLQELTVLRRTALSIVFGFASLIEGEIMSRHFHLKQLRNRKWKKDLALLMTGIGVGSGIALLLAPSTGEELRHNIGRGYHKAATNIGRRTEDLRDRAEELLEHAHDLRELGSSLLHVGRKRAA